MAPHILASISAMYDGRDLTRQSISALSTESAVKIPERPSQGEVDPSAGMLSGFSSVLLEPVQAG